MAKVSVTTDNAAEAATLAEVQKRFGPKVIDDLVTNWIKDHATTIDNERARAIVEASKVNPTFATKAVATATEATTILEADAAAKKAAAEAEEAAAAAKTAPAPVK